jgi:thiosulfate reductase/polysulfide reductase chain A
MKELAGRLGLGEYFDTTVEEYRKAQLKDLPGAMEALKQDGVYYNPSKLYGVYEGRIFKTKSKKIELFNQRYADMGIDPMPVYQSPNTPPEGSFRMVVGRNAMITQTSSQNNSLLVEFVPNNDLWINPAAAEKLGIQNGDRVVVKSPAGKQAIRAQVTHKTRPDTVYMHSGFGVLSPGLSNIHGKGACIVELIEDNMDELTGNMAMHETFVTVQKEA